MAGIPRDPGTEEFIDSLDGHQIYRFMRNKFEEVTDQGDDYDVETHDETVMKLASDKFGISKEEVGDLYASFEMKIAKFWQSRKK